MATNTRMQSQRVLLLYCGIMQQQTHCYGMPLLFKHSTCTIESLGPGAMRSVQAQPCYCLCNITCCHERTPSNGKQCMHTLRRTADDAVHVLPGQDEQG
jgi:hypothetical protein